MAGHGGIAPEIANPVFQKAASDEFIVTTVRNGRRNTAMPSFQPQVPGALAFSDSQLGDLLAYIRALGGPQPGASAIALSSQKKGEAAR